MNEHRCALFGSATVNALHPAANLRNRRLRATQWNSTQDAHSRQTVAMRNHPRPVYPYVLAAAATYAGILTNSLRQNPLTQNPFSSGTAGREKKILAGPLIGWCLRSGCAFSPESF